MTVINLDDHRHPKNSGSYDGATCRCGEAWFELRGDRVAVCLTREGSISGHVGHPHCISCGSPWQPGMNSD